MDKIPMSTFHFSNFLLLVFVIAGSQAQSPGCPNGQEPKLDNNLRPLQCLPGTSQHAICGPNHNCYFTGLNYMCCPSNEPTVDNQPSCPYPKLTVLDPHGLPMKCSPIARLCPEEQMHCSDVGLGYICCENPSFQQKHNDKQEETTVPVSKFRVRTTTPLPEEELECPAQSIGLLHPNGSRIICNSRNPCFGDDTFCYGEYKRSICCQKYLYAGDILEDPTTTTTTTARTPLRPKSITLRKHIVHEGQFKKQAITLPPPVVDAEFPQIAINSIGVRRAGSIASTGIVLKSSELGSSERSWIPRTSFQAPPSTRRPVPTTTTTTSTTTTTTTTTTPKPVPAGLSRRHHLNGVQTTGDFKPASLNLEKSANAQEDRHALAQKLLQYQIRNGWPYDERFYRPDVDIYTEEQRSEIARMRFLPRQQQ